MTDVSGCVLAVDEEPLLRLLQQPNLRPRGLRVFTITVPAQALADMVRENSNTSPSVLRHLHSNGGPPTRQPDVRDQIPIIVVWASGHMEDEGRAIDSIAGEHSTDPLDEDERLVRFRGASHDVMPQAPPNSRSVVEVGPLRIDLCRIEVTLAGKTVHLTPIEYRLLVVLALHVGTVVTHQQLLNEVWGAEHEHQTNYLRVYMTQLRRKLDPGKQRPKLLVTQPGVGYGLRASATDGQGP
jgi:two-component system, OmpR family, KDP operon response regulator KdpE